IVRSANDGLIGGANLIVTALAHGPHGTPSGCTVNLNYIFVVPTAQHKGYFGAMVRELPELVRGLFLHTNGPDLKPLGEPTSTILVPTTIFIEQNDTYRMSA